MARVLICEPHRELLHLLERAVSRLGHEPLPWSGDSTAAELLLLDTDDDRAVACGERLRTSRPDLPVVALSIYSPSPTPPRLEPVAHLLKPFTRAELERAIATALGGTLPGWPIVCAPTAPSAI